ncbi:MAG: AmmeMemoRadiSam system protein A [Thermodesulfobacteriota bacterium]
MRMKDINLLPQEKKILLSLARAEIKSNLTGISEKIDLPKGGTLYARHGAFVTLHKHGNLRGCIGVFTPAQPLYQTVREMASFAAFKDPRFVPLTADELSDIDIEISVLSPLQKISEINEIEIGKHGIYIIKELNRGVLLPQVATEHNWDKITFLEHTCYKAGLDGDCWRSGAEIYVFTALIFGENDPGSI